MTPDAYTNQEIMLDVGDGHTLYVQDWGNPDIQTPILLLHGGPGNGVANRDKEKFDPKTQRVIFHDQRGSGKSLPSGELKNNTTHKLVADIVKILDALKVEQVLATGSSWGTTLSLAFAIEHPERVSGLVISGVFTGSEAEIKWINEGGYKATYPEVWENFVSSVPEEHKHDPAAYHLSQVISGDYEKIKASAYAYETMEVGLLTLTERISMPPLEDYEPGAILIEMHYSANNFFMPKNYLLEKAPNIDLPVWIIQGRYDMVCPPTIAYRLHQTLPNSELIWTINGHLNEHEANTVIKLALKQLQGQS